MGNAAFVLAAIGVSAVGSLLLWLRHRRPKTFMSSIDDFQREMQALGRDPETTPYRRRSTFRQRSVDQRAKAQERTERR